MPSPVIRKLNGLLKTNTLGKIIHYEDEIGSTNQALFELGEKGASEGAVFIADSQSMGRGRLERSWISPPGKNLYISVLFRPEILASSASMFTLIASISLIEVIKKLEIEAEIKWPNDIRIDGKKVAGVLTEMRPKREMVDFIIVGIGVNINLSRDEMNSTMGDVSRIATSISENAGREIDRAKFASDLLLELENWYQVYMKRGSKQIVSEWTNRWGDINKNVRVSSEDNASFEGAAVGIDNNGYLMVKLDRGETVKVIAGDVEVV